MDKLFVNLRTVVLFSLAAWAMWSTLFFVLKRKLGFGFNSHKKSSRGTDAEYYDYLKFKYEQKLQYKLDKYRISLAERERDDSTDGKPIPWYIRVIK